MVSNIYSWGTLVALHDGNLVYDLQGRAVGRLRGSRVYCMAGHYVGKLQDGILSLDKKCSHRSIGAPSVLAPEADTKWVAGGARVEPNAETSLKKPRFVLKGCARELAKQ